MAYSAIAGTASMTVNGQSYRVRGSFKYSPSSVKRETVTGMDGVHGFKETPVAPYISATLSDSDGLIVSDLNKQMNVTVVAILANGKTVTGRNMATIDVQEVDSAEGSLDVRWEGAEVIEEVL